MSESEKLCLERHTRLEKHNELQDRRLNNHSERIDKIEQAQAGTTVEIRELCKRIDSLVKSNEKIMDSFKWGNGVILASLLGFFIWYIQKL